MSLLFLNNVCICFSSLTFQIIQAKTQNHHVKPIRHVFTRIDKNKHPGDKKHPEEKEIETDRTLKP